jgi:hypothetical protein
LASPRAMVSTSGSSGMASLVYSEEERTDLSKGQELNRRGRRVRRVNYSLGVLGVLGGEMG